MEYTKEEQLIIKTSMEYSYDKFWDAIEEAAESKDKNEVEEKKGEEEALAGLSALFG